MTTMGCATPLVVSRGRAGYMLPGTSPATPFGLIVTELARDWTLDRVAQLAAGVGARTVYLHDLEGMAIDSSAVAGVELTGSEPEPWRWRAIVDGRPISVVDLAGDVTRSSGPWEGLDARELLAAFAAFERLVGVPWGDSIGHTAESLILSTHPKERGGVLLDREPVTPAELAGGSLEGPWASWQRERTKAEARALWVHSYDANAQYLAAWGTVELGHGRPAHHGPEQRFDYRIVGFWRIPKIGMVRNIRPLLPAVVLEGREWFATATVRRLLEVCDGLEAPDVAESWTWPRKSRFLLGASSKLRDARLAALDEYARASEAMATANTVEAAGELLRRSVTAQAVREAVGAMYQVQTGRFGMEGRASTSPWARPDWGHTVRAQARANLHRRLDKLRAAPFAIATDGLLFATDEPDGRRFASSIDLELGRNLGQFRYQGTAPAPLVFAAGEGRRGVRSMFEAASS